MPCSACRLCYVDRVLQEDDRIVVGVGDRARSGCLCGANDGLRCGFGLQAVEAPGFRDIPVLAELACEIAARSAEREDGRARQEVVQGLLLDRVDAEAR